MKTSEVVAGRARGSYIPREACVGRGVLASAPEHPASRPGDRPTSRTHRWSDGRLPAASLLHVSRVMASVGVQSHAPIAMSAAEAPKMNGHSLKGRKATLNPVNKETIASTANVPIATA